MGLEQIMAHFTSAYEAVSSHIRPADTEETPPLPYFSTDPFRQLRLKRTSVEGLCAAASILIFEVFPKATGIDNLRFHKPESLTISEVVSVDPDNLLRVLPTYLPFKSLRWLP